MLINDLEWKTPFDAEFICLRHMGPFSMFSKYQNLFYFIFIKKIRPPNPEKVVLESSAVVLFEVHHTMRNIKLRQATDFGDPSLNME